MQLLLVLIYSWINEVSIQEISILTNCRIFHIIVRNIYISVWFYVLVQSISHVQLFATPWTVARQASLSFTISWSLLKLMSIESVMPSNLLSLCCPLLLLPSTFPEFRSFLMSWLFTSGGLSIGTSASASVLPMNIQHWFPLGCTVGSLPVQETLKSLLQHHNSKASMFGAQPSLWSNSHIHIRLLEKS